LDVDTWDSPPSLPFVCNVPGVGGLTSWKLLLTEYTVASTSLAMFCRIVLSHGSNYRCFVCFSHCLWHHFCLCDFTVYIYIYIYVCVYIYIYTHSSGGKKHSGSWLKLKGNVPKTVEPICSIAHSNCTIARFCNRFQLSQGIFGNRAPSVD
jgi:hypothetical protein